jgi:hypothetical protein
VVSAPHTIGVMFGVAAFAREISLPKHTVMLMQIVCRSRTSGERYTRWSARRIWTGPTGPFFDKFFRRGPKILPRYQEGWNNNLGRCVRWCRRRRQSWDTTGSTIVLL